jgi:tetratricopeptide (TPR) repeat protein
LCNLALLKTISKDFSGSKKYLEKALQLDNRNDAIYLNLGFVSLVEGNLDSALNNFNKAIEINNNNYLAFLNLGDVYFKKGDIAKAFHYWRKVSNELNLFYLLSRRLCYLRSNYLGFEDWLNDFEITLDKILNQILINPELLEKPL